MRRPPATHLFEQIATFGALLGAAEKALAGKRRHPEAAAFQANREHTLLMLQDALQNGTWRPGPYTVFEVKIPKPRRISAAPFADRVVHHALCQVVAPILARSFIDNTYANRTGKGTHRAVACYERYRDTYKHVLRCDIYRYFPAIDHAILKRDFRRVIGCERTLALMDLIVDGSNPQEPVDRYFQGDDLFDPFARRRGLPIGNLTSQWFGNFYLNGFDHYVTEVLRAPYVRYVDDFALFADSESQLCDWREAMSTYLQGRRLLLHPRKTRVQSTQEPARFLGYELFGSGKRRLPDDNVNRFRGRLQSLRRAWKAGEVSETDVRCRVQAWVGHACHADTLHLRHALFRGGWFDPLWNPPTGG